MFPILLIIASALATTSYTTTDHTDSIVPDTHTFFHEDQAKQVHKGEWPPVYYNSIHKHHSQQIKTRRL